MDPLVRAIVQITIFSIGIYGALRFLRGTRGGGILRGLVIFLVVLAFGLRELIATAELYHLRQIYEGFLTLSATGLIIIFQPELRRALYRLGENPLLQRFLHGDSSVIDEVTKAVVRLSRSRTGALIAFERDISIGGYVESGVAIDAAVKADLLDTIFYPGSPLHDGAVVIRDDRISAASCRSPSPRTRPSAGGSALVTAQRSVSPRRAMPSPSSSARRPARSRSVYAASSIRT